MSGTTNDPIIHGKVSVNRSQKVQSKSFIESLPNNKGVCDSRKRRIQFRVNLFGAPCAKWCQLDANEDLWEIVCLVWLRNLHGIVCVVFRDFDGVLALRMNEWIDTSIVFKNKYTTFTGIVGLS
jgi:hypothetical protein